MDRLVPVLSGREVVRVDLERRVVALDRCPVAALVFQDVPLQRPGCGDLRPEQNGLVVAPDRLRAVPEVPAGVPPADPGVG